MRPGAVVEWIRSPLHGSFAHVVAVPVLQWSVAPPISIARVEAVHVHPDSAPAGNDTPHPCAVTSLAWCGCQPSLANLPSVWRAARPVTGRRIRAEAAPVRKRSIAPPSSSARAEAVPVHSDRLLLLRIILILSSAEMTSALSRIGLFCMQRVGVHARPVFNKPTRSKNSSTIYKCAL